MDTPKAFYKEFEAMDYALQRADNILLVAHTRPDPDAVGSVIALARYIRNSLHKDVTIGCFSPFPESLVSTLGEEIFMSLEALDVTLFDLAIGCDSVDRGFDRIVPHLREACITIAIDHHHDITVETDVSIIDPLYASTTEALYSFFCSRHITISREIAVPLLVGLIGDTGIFQHANTSAHALRAAADLIRSGASISRIVSASFSNQKIETLNLWGTALEHAQYQEKIGLIITAITQDDMKGRLPTSEEIKEVATILATVPGVKVSLILFQAGPNCIKGSFRAPKEAGVDVAVLAHRFGGGGHALAAGFEMSGTIVAKEGGWRIA